MEKNMKLSLVAEFDDLCRLRNSIIASEASEDALIAFLRNQEECRLKWLSDRMALRKTEERNIELEKKAKSLEVTLKNVREYVKKELDEKEKYKKECEEMRTKMNMAAQYLKDSKANDQQKEKALSYLNVHHLDTVLECSDSGQSCSDIDYDKTDEDVLEAATVGIGKRKHEKDELRPSKKSAARELFDLNLAEDDIISSSETQRQRSYSEPKPDENAHVNVRRTPIKSDSEFDLVSNTWKGITPGSTVSAVSTPLLPKPMRISTTSAATAQDLSRLHHNNRLEQRPHKFVEKMHFGGKDKCGPCGGNIGFGRYLRCEDCRAMCHPKCRDKAPLPCIPYVAKNLTNKCGRLTKISDYVNLNSRPCVPALIIHCCAEIERRGLEEQGLYRIPGSDKEVKDLKERILKSKNGMPLLSDVDVHVLCGVVKDFLRSLDEQLLTRVLWRDFVIAAELEDPEDKRTFLYQAISELPTANRDSLAYLAVHLQRIAQSLACKMPVLNLAKVFAPTIVGHSIPNPPPMTMYSETHKQIKVMEELLSIPQEYWENFISPTKIMQNQLNTTVDRRGGVGLFGGSITNGTLTPLRYKPSQDRLKPLF